MFKRKSDTTATASMTTATSAKKAQTLPETPPHDVGIEVHETNEANEALLSDGRANGHLESTTGRSNQAFGGFDATALDYGSSDETKDNFLDRYFIGVEYTPLEGTGLHKDTIKDLRQHWQWDRATIGEPNPTVIVELVSSKLDKESEEEAERKEAQHEEEVQQLHKHYQQQARQQQRICAQQHQLQ
ncbi:hypothetical protein B0A49_12250 [Cryomyces minteri]|uniref:Uncharacterized protein n=1 Tax=Cryomyces minteri TaxID=331657 RepID=A0A4U0VQB4_9PEZI|nr:hypothetical protein B0A49_12250 [Cryomyces minteri]